jgi:hypothetical protein
MWQNLAIFGSRPIGGAVEALLTKVINLRLSVSQMFFFVAPRLLLLRDSSVITQSNSTESIILAAGGAEMLSGHAESIILSHGGRDDSILSAIQAK